MIYTSGNPCQVLPSHDDSDGTVILAIFLRANKQSTVKQTNGKT